MCELGRHSRINYGPEVVDGQWAAVEPLPEPQADGEGYYLDSVWLDTLAAHPFSPQEAKRFMVEVFPTAVRLMWCPRVEVTDGYNDFGAPVTRIEFSTMGWSGGEELIDIVLSHLWLRQLQVSWHLGGHYVFEVPREAMT